MRLEPDFEELLRLFNKHNVRYCVVGAFALAYYARPRFTQDMDIIVEPTRSNARKVVVSLAEFGFGKLKLNEDDFSKPGSIIQLGYEPVRIDILTSLTGCTFAEIWKHRRVTRYGKQKAHIIGLRELIKNKRATKRVQDKADLAILLKAKKNGNG